MKSYSCAHALSLLSNSSQIWAETKYDGERCQIHVEVLPNGKDKITIYSKSGRDSTQDRKGVHAIIRKALGLDGSEGGSRKIKKNAILDAEMVACDGERIDGACICRHSLKTPT